MSSSEEVEDFHSPECCRFVCARLLEICSVRWFNIEGLEHALVVEADNVIATERGTENGTEHDRN
jgi:hypothetical protein